jgi:hypothetical protein
MPNAKTTLRIRMYRQGLGDCFLLTFMRKNKDDFNVMVDCGLLQQTKNGKQIMIGVAEDIEASLTVEKTIKNKKMKWLDGVVLTHEHADHISGFSEAKAVFDRMHFGKVWAGWPDDEKHPNYKAVRERFKKQILGLRAALVRLKSEEQASLKAGIAAIVNEFFEDNILGAAETNGRSPAWDYALKKSVVKPKFCVPGELLEFDGLDDVRIYVLGPPENFELFTKKDPPAEETYREEGTGFAGESFFAAVSGDAELFDAEQHQPFEKRRRIDSKAAAACDFFQKHYGFGEKDKDSWRRIDDDWLSAAGNLALNLDTYTNNTCLAFAIEFISSGKVLLFPGDAQFSNWFSWQKLSWEVPDGPGQKKTVKTPDLLKRTVFYKVGHHGSHNATLKKSGLEMMTNPNLMAMIPVDRVKAKSKTSKTNPNGWQMPEENLFTRLKEKTSGRVILADEADDSALKLRCQDADFINDIKFRGEFVRVPAESTAKEPLAVELTIES